MFHIYLLEESVGERALTALKDSLLGMGVVFAALIILWGAVELLHVCVSAAEKKKKSADLPENAPETAQTLPSPAADSPVPAEDEAAIVAAITAAIALATEEPVGSFRVVSFKRSEPHAGWNRHSD